ncbi:GNAT family N-acetyltransferase [Kitasatospora paracochleata]|uniref:RimJ/RimL family protein N-acetyltransferase n=1 Tax=Kitasatospora paracochleata TaxID=58354 RepID=A0ABT1J391_9ACTN|nr:GNAT family N-acetyltransferase [Kitasatospora paracochleata]MCP2311897.1 RimJ/RimL family protein N-acetyltransferase [Kitasatospora paracochleata]
MTFQPPVPPVVPAGRMASGPQPVLPLDSGLELRPWQVEDAPVLAAAGRDPGIRQWNLLAEETDAQAEQRIERMHRRRQAETAVIWAVAGTDGVPVGLIGWTGIDLAGGSAEIVYWLLPAGRGRGVAVEATRRISRWAFDDLGLHRLTLCHSVANPASCRVAGKAGFSYEGTMRGALLHENGWHDQHLHALLRSDPA